MSFVYNLLIRIIELSLNIFKYFDKKIYLFLEQRKHIFSDLKSSICEDEKYIWLHVASLGEYEQGLPVFKKIKSLYKDHKIILSFFSSSGYDLRKTNPISDLTTYLPLDSKHNAKKFLELIKPELAVFVKYEFWPNFLIELRSREIPTYLLAGIFRKNHWFFKFYGSWMKNNLKAFNHFFVQNEVSKNILKENNFDNCSIMGDSRFDRVIDLPNQKIEIKKLNKFKGSKKCLVAGSTWEQDEQMIIEFINNYKKNDTCFIIAPHQIDLNKINTLKNRIEKKSIKMSNIDNNNDLDFSVIIIDSIGLLTSLYSYADISYVGGGMGSKGLHNILEAAVYKIPVLIGKNFKNFPEAKSLVRLGGVISVQDQYSFSSELTKLLINISRREKMGQINYNFIKENLGASEKVISFLKQKI